jgi:hypothetical protein
VCTEPCVGRCCDTGVIRTEWSCTRRKVISCDNGSSSRLFEGNEERGSIIRALLTSLRRYAPEIVLKRTPSVTISACVLTNTRSYLPSIKACGLNQIKEGSELPSHESGENLCVRALSNLYSPRHFETHHPLFWTDLSFLEVTKLKYWSPAPRRGVCPRWGRIFFNINLAKFVYDNPKITILDK